MGTTVQSITGRTGDGPGQALFPERSGAPWQRPPQHSIESPEANFSSPAQNGGSLFVQAAAAQGGPLDSSGSSAAQRNAAQVLGAGVGGPNARGPQTPVPAGGPGGPGGGGGGQANMERRGPVEFNHAISYVNKIKVSE